MSYVRLFDMLEARQQDSAVSCIPPSLPAHSPLIAQAAAAARVADKGTVFDAAKYGNFALVQDHLTADASCVGRRDVYECSPLHHSAVKGDIDICRLLLQSNADLEAKNWDLWTPLHASAEYGHPDICRLLLQRNANLEVKTKGGLWTPLHYSSASGHLEICRLLVASKANVAARSSNGKTALNLAIERKNVLVAEYLQNCPQ